MNLTGNREPETDMRSVTAPDRRLFRTQGFLQGPVFLTQDQVAAACRGMDRVIAGDYRTGREPQSRGVAPGAATTRLIKINNSHFSDEDLFAVVANGEIARWAAQLLGAKRLHVWHTQLLFKPVGGDPGAGIGFHQDWKYWQFFDQLEGVITAWVALSDITVAGGAMRFVPGSNRWGLIDPGNFSEKDEAKAIAALPLPAGEEWREHAAVMPAGAASFHHPLTLHGSGANHAAAPRRAIAVHYVSEQAQVVTENPHVSAATLARQWENPLVYDDGT